jgi:ribosomal protein S18 acetylase RimI-like enzyme
MVLLKEGLVIGFTLIQTRERVEDEHLALIAVAPECQNQGWGRKLITASIQGANLGTVDIFSIGVDLSNEIAYKLYSSMGFEVQTKLTTHIWKNKS